MRRNARWAAALLVSLAGAQCRPSGVRPLEVGDAAPSYAGVTLGGDTISVSGLRGRPILLNVWATWCVPCQDEMPAIARLDRELAGRGLQVLGVSVDAAGSAADIDRFVRELDIRFPIVVDPGQRVSRAFRTIGVPETFLIDRRGRIARRWIGAFDPLGPDVLASIERALSRDATVALGPGG